MTVPVRRSPSSRSPLRAEAALSRRVGLLVGLTSMGAGALLTPALVLLLGRPAASPSAPTCSSPRDEAVRRRRIRRPPPVALAPCSVPLRLIPARSPDSAAPPGPRGQPGRDSSRGSWGIGCSPAARSRSSLPAPLRRPAGRVARAVGTAATRIRHRPAGQHNTVGSGSTPLIFVPPVLPAARQAAVGTDIAHAFLLSVVAAAVTDPGRLSGWVLGGSARTMVRLRCGGGAASAAPVSRVYAWRPARSATSRA